MSPLGTLPLPWPPDQGVSGHAFSCSARKPQTRLTSSTCRTPPGQKTAHPPGLSRDPFDTPVSMSSVSVSTRQQRFTRVRLPGPHLTPLGCLFLIAHHDGHQPTQHEAVWSLPPPGDSEGPKSFIFRAAPLRKTRPTEPPPRSGHTKRQMYSRAGFALLRKRVILHPALPDHKTRGRTR